MDGVSYGSVFFRDISSYIKSKAKFTLQNLVALNVRQFYDEKSELHQV